MEFTRRGVDTHAAAGMQWAGETWVNWVMVLCPSCLAKALLLLVADQDQTPTLLLQLLLLSRQVLLLQSIVRMCPVKLSHIHPAQRCSTLLYDVGTMQVSCSIFNIWTSFKIKLLLRICFVLFCFSNLAGEFL